MKGRALSRYYTNNCLLLDERDFDIDEEARFEDLLPRFLEEVELHYGYDDSPELEILFVCSERHDRAWMADDCYATPQWFNAGSSWEQTLFDVICKRCLVEGSFANLLLDLPDCAESLLRENIRLNTDE